jgi:hypothetical protein
MSIDTNIYADTDLEMKAKALGMCERKLPQLLLVFSTHAFFLSGRVVETREFSATARPFQIIESPICDRQSSTGLSAVVYPFDPLTKASPLLREGAFLLLSDLL